MEKIKNLLIIDSKLNILNSLYDKWATTVKVDIRKEISVDEKTKLSAKSIVFIPKTSLMFTDISAVTEDKSIISIIDDDKLNTWAVFGLEPPDTTVNIKASHSIIIYQYNINVIDKIEYYDTILLNNKIIVSDVSGSKYIAYVLSLLLKDSTVDIVDKLKREMELCTIVDLNDFPVKIMENHNRVIDINKINWKYDKL